MSIIDLIKLVTELKTAALENYLDREKLKTQKLGELLPLVITYAKDTKIIELLVNKYGCNVDATIINGPIFTQLKKIFTRINQANLENKEDPINILGRTALVIAARENKLPLVTKLLELGANPNFTNQEGQSLLMLTSQCGYLDIVKKLIEFGVNINHCSKKGENALMIAAQHNHKAVVDLLIEHGAEVNNVDNQGWSALAMTLHYRRDSGITEALLKNHAKLTVRVKEEAIRLGDPKISAIINTQPTSQERKITWLERETQLKRLNSDQGTEAKKQRLV